MTAPANRAALAILGRTPSKYTLFMPAYCAKTPKELADL